MAIVSVGEMNLSELFKEKDWAAIIGWIIFIGLFVALLNDYYIFNPFIVGFAYYVIYALKKTLGKHKKDEEKNEYRFIVVSIIALLYLYFGFRHEDNRRQFVNQFQEKCYSVQTGSSLERERLCEAIASDINTYLYGDRGEYDYDL